MKWTFIVNKSTKRPLERCIISDMPTIKTRSIHQNLHYVVVSHGGKTLCRKTVQMDIHGRTICRSYSSWSPHNSEMKKRSRLLHFTKCLSTMSRAPFPHEYSVWDFFVIKFHNWFTCIKLAVYEGLIKYNASLIKVNYGDFVQAIFFIVTQHLIKVAK